MIRILVFRYLLLACSMLIVLSCSEDDQSPDPLNSEYELDGTLFQISTNMYWQSAGEQGAADQIRLLEPLLGSELYDLILLTPVPGPSSLKGLYIYSKTGDIGTYDLQLVHATDGVDDFLWSTNGDEGGDLEIQSMGKSEGEEIYRIILPEFTLNYGYWDYLAGKWVSQGQKQFKLTYEGSIE